MGKQEPALLQLQGRSAAVLHLFVQPACREIKDIKGGNGSCFLSRDRGATSDEELLAVHAGVSSGALQQRDPVVHLLRRVGVALQHPVGRDHDEGVGPEEEEEEE